jgi:DNA-binding phage protein
MKGFTKFDASAFLDNEGIIAEYLVAAHEADNPDLVISALCQVAKARRLIESVAADLLAERTSTDCHWWTRRRRQPA